MVHNQRAYIGAIIGGFIAIFVSGWISLLILALALLLYTYLGYLEKKNYVRKGKISV